MIIRDLQHIETATETEVKGGNFYWYNIGEARANSLALGRITYTQDLTSTTAIAGVGSSSSASSIAKAAK